MTDRAKSRRDLSPSFARQFRSGRMVGVLPQTLLPDGLLERLDLGDVAAENESRQLRNYFVRTGQFVQAKRGHARLVIGRKGSGKTAIFYAIRDSFIKWTWKPCAGPEA